MSEGTKRVVVAVVGIPLFLTAVIAGGYWLLGLIMMIQYRAVVEWSKLSIRMERRPSRIWAYALALGIDAVLYFKFDYRWVAMLTALLPIALCFETFRRDRKPMRDIASVTLYVLFIGLPFALWIPLTSYSVSGASFSINYLMLLAIATWLCDSAAYYGGRALGRHTLLSSHSPNKTWEGAIFGFAASALAVPLCSLVSQNAFPLLDFVALPVFVGIAGQIGDLLESLVKREVGIKDTSGLLPGHGGILDRFDSMLVSSPLLLSYLLFYRG